MRKSFVLISALILVGTISGCSLVPGSSTSTTNSGSTATTTKPKGNISQSLWKSTDGGKTWEAKDNVLGKVRVKDIDVLSLTFNPQDSKKILVGLKSGGIMKTANGGDSWEFLDIFTSEKVYGLAYDPKNGQVVYASGVFGGRGKIFKSEDEGTSWKEIYTAPANGPLVISLIVDKNNPETVYASTSDNEVLKSVDGGASWGNIMHSDSPVLRFAIDSENSNLVYFVNQSGDVFRTMDGGKEGFENISKKLSGAFSFSKDFSVIKTSPTRSKTVYLAGKGGMIVSEDSGETWKKIVALSDPENFPIGAFAISSNLNEMAYGSSQAAYRSSDGGVNWTSFQFDIKKSPDVMEFDPNDNNVLYLGFKK